MGKRRDREAEDAARELAIAFVRSQTRTEPRCESAAGRDTLWKFRFRIRTVPGEVIDPSHWIVEVDLSSRTARFFDVL